MRILFVVVQNWVCGPWRWSDDAVVWIIFLYGLFVSQRWRPIMQLWVWWPCCDALIKSLEKLWAGQSDWLSLYRIKYWHHDSSSRVNLGPVMSFMQKSLQSLGQGLRCFDFSAQIYNHWRQRLHRVAPRWYWFVNSINDYIIKPLGTRSHQHVRPSFN